MGRFDAADVAADDALRLLEGDPDPAARRLRLRVSITRAWTDLETRGLDTALRGLHRVRQEARTTGDPLLVALSLVQESVVHVRVGNWRAVVAACDAVAPDAPMNPSQWCAMWINRGFALIGLGELEDATASLVTARDLAVAHGLVDQEFKARHNLACLAFVDGDLPRALTLMREADRMDATVARDRARLDHAEVLIAAGLLDGARARLRDALVDARADAHRLEMGEISLRLARCDLAAGDLASAREHARTALAVWRSRQADELVREAALLRATVDVTEGRDLPAVVEELARRTTEAPSAGATTRATLRLEAEARLLLGDVDGAESRLRALDSLQGSGPDSRESLSAGLHDALVRARLADARGLPVDAARRLDDGNRLLAAHQFQSSSLDVRAALATHGRRLAAYDVERALAGADAPAVLTTAERWRAVSHRVTPVTAPPDPELSELLRELRRLRQVVADDGSDRDDEVLREVARLEAQVTEREWSLTVRDAREVTTAPVDADEAVAAARDRDAVVVDFFESQGVLHVAVVGPEGVVHRELGDVQRVGDLVTRLRRDLRARTNAGAASPLAPILARATASSVAAVDAILASVLPGAGRVVVVPSRHLAATPWGLLPSLRGRPVTVSPSLTRWVRGPVRPVGEAPGPGPRVGPTDRVHGPDGPDGSDGSDGPDGSGLEPVRALAGPGLARSTTEAAGVGAAWGLPVGRPAPEGPPVATSTEVLDALGTARVVHLAAHGTHEAQSPLFSSVRMADGPVFAHEFPRPVAAEHVALSACDVGQVASRTGDEPLGLAVALVSLGATSVLGAVAPVADELAAEAMVEYHRLLAGGTDASASWAAVVERRPDAGVFCVYGSDWSAPAPSLGRGLR